MPPVVRLRSSWPGWLAWVVPASLALLVISYQIIDQVFLDRARSSGIFLAETLVFGLLGPWGARLLLRQLARDVTTSRAAAEQINALRAQEKYLASAVASSADAVIGLDPQGRILTWNQSAEELFGYQAAEVIGRLPTDRLFPDDAGRAAWRALQVRVAAGGAVRSYEVLASTANGHRLPADVSYTRTYDEDGHLLGGVAILRDMSQRQAVAAEEVRRGHELAALFAVSAAMNQALTEEDALHRALGRVLDVLALESGGIYLLNPQTGRLTLAAAQGNADALNPAEPALLPDAYLVEGAEPIGEPPPAADPGADPHWPGGRSRHNGYACASVPLPAQGGTLGVLKVAGRREPGFSDADMALLRAVGAQIGVAMENMRLREAARRAEALSTLIQEMHHRIKNNLQTVADLLSLEMSASPSPAARKSLRDSITRIKSIAAVHELLSLEQLRLTDITQLARQVCDISLRHLVRPDQRVTAEIIGPAIYLPSKPATALALVMNELIANALEHAFSLSGRGGRLAITIAQEGAQVTITIADNGRGLPPDFDLAKRRGLGLQIVQTLVEKDLAGTLRLENNPAGGSRATLTFYK